MLRPIGSANQAAPSGATASRPRRTIGVSSGKLVTSPEGVMRDTACAAMSVYQALPSGATARPSGSSLPGFGRRSSCPSRTRPMASAPPIENQTVPSSAAAMPIGMSSGSGIGYSTNCGDPPLPQTRYRPAAASAASAMTAAASRPRRRSAGRRRELRHVGAGLRAGSSLIGSPSAAVAAGRSNGCRRTVRAAWLLSSGSTYPRGRP